jgi:hypothetical protein
MIPSSRGSLATIMSKTRAQAEDSLRLVAGGRGDGAKAAPGNNLLLEMTKYRETGEEHEP